MRPGSGAATALLARLRAPSGGDDSDGPADGSGQEGQYDLLDMGPGMEAAAGGTGRPRHPGHRQQAGRRRWPAVAVAHRDQGRAQARRPVPDRVPGIPTLVSTDALADIADDVLPRQPRAFRRGHVASSVHALQRRRGLRRHQDSGPMQFYCRETSSRNAAISPSGNVGAGSPVAEQLHPRTRRSTSAFSANDAGWFTGLRSRPVRRGGHRRRRVGVDIESAPQQKMKYWRQPSSRKGIIDNKAIACPGGTPARSTTARRSAPALRDPGRPWRQPGHFHRHREQVEDGYAEVEGDSCGQLGRLRRLVVAVKHKARPREEFISTPARKASAPAPCLRRRHQPASRARPRRSPATPEFFSNPADYPGRQGHGGTAGHLRPEHQRRVLRVQRQVQARRSESLDVPRRRDRHYWATASDD